ncbi:hypothetical protein [Anaerosinus gibii]|uniref:Uncharacterized protein n=1 Tax=Selenobaculum gibii TaxID=3054208 RepID=A0A9Y2AI38_9FIRM|nr:hypothetical protein [Selenobaculum gbiensis]WIW70632.1 hypothetical protein P3F81_12210 [Selenobaculum gbiensis]
MDLNKIVNDKLAKIEADGYLEEVVEKRLKETISSVVSDLFSSYSDFSKDLESKIKEKLNINLEELNISSYNVMVMNAINDYLQEEVSICGIEKIKNEMNALLCDTKTEYKLSEIIREMKDHVTEYDDDYWGKEMSFHCSDPNGILIFICFDPKEDVEEYRCKYRLTVNKEGIVTSVRIRDCEFNNRTIMGGLYGVEATLFKLYTTGAKLVLDDHNIVLEYASEEEEY